jgi:DNA-binding transcriptional LysR family regulator
METNRITYFLILCEELHFTRAAKRCGISQPSLTNAIRALEEEFGGSLFCRKPKPALTELGTAVQPHLREALRQIELANSKAHAHGRERKRRSRRNAA